MDSKIAVMCFTDLKGFTPLTERLGHDGIRPYREDYLRIGKLLAELVGGNYIKSLGDAHMVNFDKIEPSLRFAMQLQQYYIQQPCHNREPLDVRIGLYLGVVEPGKDDVAGSGVNRASRVADLAPPGEIWVNKELVEAVERIWGPIKTSKYFGPRGEFKLKGINDPPVQTLFLFDWRALSQEDPNFGLARVVLKHLETASVVLSNFSINDIGTPASIIWPVVPRDVVNAIHRGQIEIIRLLVLLGWNVHVLIADCGARDNTPRTESDKFRRLVEEYMNRRNLKGVKFYFMSELYTPGSDCCRKIHEYFQQVISELTLNDLLLINDKDYEASVKETIKASATLDFLRPALTIAAVLRLSQELGGKSVVVVGYDENIQWERGHAIKGSREQFGVLFNPILKKKLGYQARQIKDWPFWDSWGAMVDEMNHSNLAEWTTKLHAYLPGFPSKCVTIEGCEISPDDWQDEEKLLDKISREALAKYVFNEILSI